MRTDRLLLAEFLFLREYPDAFASPVLADIGKRHPIDRLAVQAQEQLALPRFRRPGLVLDAVVKLVTRSSMVSLFEKPRFRDLVNGLPRDDRARLAEGFRQRLHGDAAQGFDLIADVLSEHRLAKWSLVSVVPFYMAPTRELFIKPTTTKGILQLLAPAGLTYRSQPTWAFYLGYREFIDRCKDKVDPRLSVNNAAFTGFLMMMLRQGIEP
ncbi:MAG: hypothetical protein ACO377_09075 [Pseudomonadales bacterium]